MPRGCAERAAPCTGRYGRPSSHTIAAGISIAANTACSARANTGVESGACGEEADPTIEAPLSTPGTASMRASAMGSTRWGATTDAPRRSHMAATFMSKLSGSPSAAESHSSVMAFEGVAAAARSTVTRASSQAGRSAARATTGMNRTVAKATAPTRKTTRRWMARRSIREAGSTRHPPGAQFDFLECVSPRLVPFAPNGRQRLPARAAPFDSQTAQILVGRGLFPARTWRELGRGSPTFVGSPHGVLRVD